MGQSHSQVLIHLVFSTKHRTPWLQDKALRHNLFAYMATILKDIECPAIVINGVEDHVHILCVLSRKVSIAKLVEEVKTEPSKWMKKQGEVYAEFHWQNGYGAFSVSHSHVEQVAAYIADQEKHHRKKTFNREFETLVEKYGLEWFEEGNR